MSVASRARERARIAAVNDARPEWVKVQSAALAARRAERLAAVEEFRTGVVNPFASQTAAIAALMLGAAGQMGK